MERNISVPKAKEHNKGASTVLPTMPGTDTVVVHVGSNDIRRASSEHLKIDLKKVILALRDSKKGPIISGPVPSLGRGCERFSRLLASHIWLKYYCSSTGVTFIDNFDTFWKQKILYRNDGVHPNLLGSSVHAFQDCVETMTGQ
jgi:lysophospholipase L1-like esterase